MTQQQKITFDFNRSLCFKILARVTFHSLLLTIFAFISNAQSYPIPQKSATIGYLSFFGPPGLPGAGNYGSIENLESRDTIINNKTYQYWNTHLTRYEANRMWYVDPYKSAPDSLVERVYYDFNLTENDSFMIFDEYNAVVTDVSTYNTPNGQQRKRIRLFIEEMTGGERMDWIEGIGDVNNGILYENQLGLSDMGSLIVCVTDSSGLVYKKQGFEVPCDSLEGYVSLYETSATTKNTTQVEIWPNPFHNWLNIKALNQEKLKLVSVFNSSGQLLLQSNKSTIETHAFEKGIYFIKIDYDSELYYRKMIKN